MGNHGAVISMHKMCIKYYIFMCVYVHIMSLNNSVTAGLSGSRAGRPGFVYELLTSGCQSPPQPAPLASQTLPYHHLNKNIPLPYQMQCK